MIEQLISGMVKTIGGSYNINYHAIAEEEPLEVDFTPLFRRVSMLDGLEEVLKYNYPSLDDPDERKMIGVWGRAWIARCGRLLIVFL